MAMFIMIITCASVAFTISATSWRFILSILSEAVIICSLNNYFIVIIHIGFYTSLLYRLEIPVNLYDKLIKFNIWVYITQV